MLEAMTAHTPHFGERVRKRREEIALSQSAAARKAGVGRTTWIGWEKRDVAPERHRYVLIEQALEWEPGSVEAALAGRDPQPIGAPAMPTVLPIDPAALASYDPADRAAVIAVVRAAERRAAARRDGRHSNEGSKRRAS